MVTRINDPRLRVRGSHDDHAFIKLLCDIFSYEPVRVDEPVVYFEDCYVNDGHRTNDIELLERVALVVGKQNIVVKRHPAERSIGSRLVGTKLCREPICHGSLFKCAWALPRSCSYRWFPALPSRASIFFDERPRTVLLHRLMQADSVCEASYDPNGYEAYLERISDERSPFLIPSKN